jgi:hypothetical protein
LAERIHEYSNYLINLENKYQRLGSHDSLHRIIWILGVGLPASVPPQISFPEAAKYQGPRSFICYLCRFPFGKMWLSQIDS